MNQPLVLVIITLFLIIIEIHIKRMKTNKVLSKFYPDANLNKEEIKELSYTLIKVLKQKSKIRMKKVGKQDEAMEIIGILKNHIRFCNINQCKCGTLRFDMEELQAPLKDAEPIAIDKKIEGGSQEASLGQIIYQVLNLTLRNMGLRSNSGETEILQAYINYYMINKLFNALYNIMLAEEFNLSLFEEFNLFCLRYVACINFYRKTIEIRMLEEERRNTSSMGANFGNVVSFHKKYMRLHDLISDTTKLYCRYWGEYLKSRPGILPLTQ